MSPVLDTQLRRFLTTSNHGRGRGRCGGCRSALHRVGVDTALAHRSDTPGEEEIEHYWWKSNLTDKVPRAA
jgi:hypothetical protein